MERPPIVNEHPLHPDVHAELDRDMLCHDTDGDIAEWEHSKPYAEDSLKGFYKM